MSAKFDVLHVLAASVLSKCRGLLPLAEAIFFTFNFTSFNFSCLLFSFSVRVENRFICSMERILLHAWKFQGKWITSFRYGNTIQSCVGVHCTLYSIQLHFISSNIYKCIACAYACAKHHNTHFPKLSECFLCLMLRASSRAVKMSIQCNNRMCLLFVYAACVTKSK